jgi:hypothetical protein
MPFAWATVFLQLGYIAWWAGQRWGLLRAAIGITILGALNIPTYEYLAKASNLWIYQGVKLLFDTVPYYVILAEALICLALPWLVTWMQKKPIKWSVLFGVVEGFWIWGVGVLAYWLIR